MSASLDLSRWPDPPCSLARRRLAIATTGLRHLLRLRFFRLLLTVAWAAGVAVAAAGFLFSQSVASGGWIESWAAQLGPRAQAIGSAFCALILMYPDICITGVSSTILFAHSFVALGLSLIALTVLVPRLIARDRGTNALAIYLARPLTAGDYLVGKLGIVAGVLVLLWTGPLLVGWALSVLFAPSRDFLLYSLGPLLRAGLFNALATVVLATVVLGVSSLARTTRHSVLVWIGLWIVAGWVARFPFGPDWLRFLSFTYDLDQLRLAIFGLDRILSDAVQALPLTNAHLTRSISLGGKFAQTSHLLGALVGLVLFVGLSCACFFRRLRPE